MYSSGIKFKEMYDMQEQAGELMHILFSTEPLSKKFFNTGRTIDIYQISDTSGEDHTLFYSYNTEDGEREYCVLVREGDMLDEGYPIIDDGCDGSIEKAALNFVGGSGLAHDFSDLLVQTRYTLMQNYVDLLEQFVNKGE